MTKEVKTDAFTWIHKPSLYIQDEEKFILETEPFTEFNPKDATYAPIELYFDVEAPFMFTMKVEYHYNTVFDQCGMVFYTDHERKAIVGTEYQDIEMQKLHCTVFHELDGDRSEKNISSSIETMYYRIWCRSNAVRIQHSFNGNRFFDLRKFKVPEDSVCSVGIYACSPTHSSFDSTFSKMILNGE